LVSNSVIFQFSTSAAVVAFEKCRDRADAMMRFAAVLVQPKNWAKFA
jgi:hypothetical protein